MLPLQLPINTAVLVTCQHAKHAVHKCNNKRQLLAAASFLYMYTVPYDLANKRLSPQLNYFAGRVLLNSAQHLKRAC
jgi:hypothetical protein